MTNTLKQKEIIDKSIRWIDEYDPEHYEGRFLQLVDERRKLLTIHESEKDNPAIAAYGVSQVGKSYMINCLLQKNGNPFMIKGEDREYNFIEEMNPKTKDTEATGVVTRFSSFSIDPQRASEKYPILMRCLSVIDIILILSDGYYKDLCDFTTYSEAEITEKAENFYNKYKNRFEIPESPVQADGILNIKAYFAKHLKAAQAFGHTDFFEKVALVANRIPIEDWVEVFAVLWHDSPYMIKLAKKLLETLRRFNFSKYVYLPPQALLHNGINENTVMSVQCLNGLFKDNAEFKTDVYLRNGDKYTKLSNLSKSEVCAVCAEIIVKIGEEYLENTNSYCFTDIEKSVAAKLSHEKVSMSILKDNDLLDFPGARSRLNIQHETLDNDDLLLQVLLRGKVAYFFNTYNESKRINILLYCHHHEKNEVTEIPLMLGDWILNNIGRTMEKRRNTLQLTDNISPLFYIGTKFNIDMGKDPEAIANSINALRGRWEARFKKVLYKECFNVDGNLDDEKQKLFLNWTRPNERFQNSYLLRDYKFSGPDASKLYKNEKSNPDESEMLIPRDYYEDMRSTFCESEHVKQFFSDPELAWDVCASINNDGALYILENLKKVAAKLKTARNELYQDVVNAASDTVNQIMSDYYVSDDDAELLEQNIQKANNVFRELYGVCAIHPEYFGHLIQNLQLSESSCYSELLKLAPNLGTLIIDGPEVQDYEIIREKCDYFEGCETEEDNWNRLMNRMKFPTKEAAAKWLESKHIECKKLFEGAQVRRTASSVITNYIITLWKKRIGGRAFANEFAGASKMEDVVLSDLIDCICNAAGEVGMAKLIETEIAPYTDILDLAKINYDLVADIIATKISDFVMDFGYNSLKQDKKDNARDIASEQDLDCFQVIERNRPENYDEATLTKLLDDILKDDHRLTKSYLYYNDSWIAYMYVAFIAHLNKKHVNHAANSKVKEILDELKS